MINNIKITVVILAGGKSSRMHTDKGLVYLNGKMMIEYILDEAKLVSDTIIIISNNAVYSQFKFPCYKDIIKDCGPMGGIYTGLQYSSAQKNLVLSCDAPFVSSVVLSMLINQIGEEDALIAEYQNEVQPLCAVYDKRCTNLFRQLIEEGKLKMKDALQQLNTVKINFDHLEMNAANLFANINTPDELNKYQLAKNEN